MEPAELWAAVEFTAENSDTGALLTRAAQAGLHPYCITALPGGFRARCAAWNYRHFASLARRFHVRLRLRKKRGLFFRLRPLLRRTGLWVGAVLFLPLLFWSRGLVWAMDYSTLTRGQQARAAAVLRECALLPGAVVTEEKLAEGEYLLLQSGEFSWASLNFAGGRLRVEAAAAVPVPQIAAGSARGIRARCGGVVTRVNLVSGTMLVAPGQQVEAGQGLIGTARSERDGSLIFGTACGTVEAQFEWSDSQSVPLSEQVLLPDAQRGVSCRVFFENKFSSSVRFFIPQSKNALQRVLWVQPEFFGFRLPFTIEQTVVYGQQRQTVRRTRAQALALARLRSEQALYAAFPGANLLARREGWHEESQLLNYTAVYTVNADICE